MRSMRPWYEKAKAELKKQCKTYGDIARVCSVTTGAVGHWLVGRNNPRIEDIQKIAKLLGQTVSDLCGEDAYFVVDMDERRYLDKLRAMPEDERRIALKMFNGLDDGSQKTITDSKKPTQTN